MLQFRILDYNYIFDSIAITPTTEDSSFPASNLQKFQRCKVYRSTSALAQRIVFDMQTPVSIDTILVLFDRDADILISSGATFKVEAHPTNHWSSPDYSSSLTIDDTNHCATKYLTTAQTYRFWSIYVNDPYNTVGYFEIAKVLMGEATLLSQMPSLPFEVQSADLSKIDESPYGYRFSDVYPSVRSASFPHRVLTEADKIILKDIFNRVGRVKPIALCLDPAEDFFADAGEHMFYGYLDTDFKALNNALDYFDVDVTIREAV